MTNAPISEVAKTLIGSAEYTPIAGMTKSRIGRHPA